MKQYRATFQFFDTEEQARTFCDKQNALASAAVKTEQKTSLQLGTTFDKIIDLCKEENTMSYREFLDNIDAYVGKVVEFTSRFKADGNTFKTERYVWNNKDFGEPDKDALIEIIEVKVIRDGNLNTSVKGIIGVK